MKHDPIAAWRREHADYVKLLDVLQRELQAIEQEGKPNYAVMVDILTYLRNQPDRHHHPREDVAFRRIAELEPKLGTQVADLHGEHAALAEMGEAVLRALENVLGGGIMARDVLAAQIREYVSAYRNHIAAEEESVIPAAARLLSAKDWAAAELAQPGELDPLFGNAPDARYRDLRRVIEGEAAD